MKWLSKNPHNQVDSKTKVLFQENCFYFRSSKKGSCLLVIELQNPLIISEGLNCSAKIDPSLEGKVGYPRLPIRIDYQKGLSQIYLKEEAPPRSVIPNTNASVTHFCSQLKSRKSAPPSDLQEVIQWQKKYREQLGAILFGKRQQAFKKQRPQLLSTEKRAAYTLNRYAYVSRENRPLEFLLTIPCTTRKNLKKPPLLIGIHGHEATWGDADPGAFKKGHPDDFMEFFARKGWAVLQPTTMNHHLQDPTMTLQGEWTHDIIKAIDAAQELGFTNADQIYTCGLSTGGHLALNLLIFDDRVKGGILASILTTWNHVETRLRTPPHCNCGIHTQLSNHLEQCDWFSLAAPKPLLIMQGRKDLCYFPGANPKKIDLEWMTGVLPLKEYQVHYQEIVRIYKTYSQSRVLTHHIHNGGHQVDSPKAFRWLESRLKDNL